MNLNAFKDSRMMKRSKETRIRVYMIILTRITTSTLLLNSTAVDPGEPRKWKKGTSIPKDYDIAG